MQRTTNYNFKKPDYTDFADIQDINDNMDAIDEELAAPTGDLANAKIKSSTASTASYPVPAANDTMKVMLGKIIKFCADIVKVFTGATSTRAGAKGLVPAPAANQHTRFLRADGTWREPVNGAGTTTAGDVLDARMGKTLNDKINTLNDSLYGVMKVVHTPLSVTTDANGGFTLYNRVDGMGKSFTVNNVLCVFVTGVTSNYYCIISTYNTAVYGVVRDSITNAAVASATLTIDVVSYYVIE